MPKTVLVTSRDLYNTLLKKIPALFEEAEVICAENEEEIKNLESIQVIFTIAWPSFLDKKLLESMKNLKMIQTILAGVDVLPFSLIPEHVLICSNAGGYNEAVAEHAWAMILYLAKKLEIQYEAIKTKKINNQSVRKFVEEMILLHGKTFGVLGMGGIGSKSAEIARVFGMKIFGISRSSKYSSLCDEFGDLSKIKDMISKSDVILISLPLNKYTKGIIGKEELRHAKEEAIMVNVSRAEIINEEALYEHLKNHPKFFYATDVWYRDERGGEKYNSRFPFFQLPNFFGTPHTSGPLGYLKGFAIERAAENILRFLKGQTPLNIVRREDYENWS